MLTHIRIKDFKSLRRVDLQLGAMNLFVGPNASGKSNFFDALRVLQGVGNGYTVTEILDGKPRGATNEAWDGIRGGSAKACFEGRRRRRSFCIEVGGQLSGSRGRAWRYAVTMSPECGWIKQESLELGGRPIFESKAGDVAGPSHLVKRPTGTQGRPREIAFERTRPVLCQFPSAEGVTAKGAITAEEVADQLADMQRIDPTPAILRGYSQAPSVERMGERGETSPRWSRSSVATGTRRQATWSGCASFARRKSMTSRP